MRKNHLRELIDSGRPSLGTRLLVAWPTIIELAGQSGVLDYVEFLAEYAPYTHFTLENQGRAVDLFDRMSAMVKIEQESRQHLAARALSAGIQNVLFTDIRSAEDVRDCVRFVRAETPELGGLRGVAMGRDVGVVLEVGSPAYVQSTVGTVIGVMIEKQAALQNLDAILDVDGVDMVQFGPADYAMSIGLAGQFSHPAVLEAERKVIEAAFRRGLHPRAEIQHPDQAARYLEMGVRHFCLGTDVVTLMNYWREHGSRMRDLMPL